MLNSLRNQINISKKNGALEQVFSVYDVELLLNSIDIWIDHNRSLIKENQRYISRMKMLENRLSLFSEIEAGKFDDLAKLRSGR